MISSSDLPLIFLFIQNKFTHVNLFHKMHHSNSNDQTQPKLVWTPALRQQKGCRNPYMPSQ